MSAAVSGSIFCAIREENRLIFELPRGKIGKDGEVTLQKGQKGQTCFFYAMKRLLTNEQIRSPHGKECALRRKMITAGGSGGDSVEEYYRTAMKANQTFLRAKGIDPEVAARDFYIDILKKGMAEMPAEYFSPAGIAELMAMVEPLLVVQKPWYKVEHMNAAAHRVMARGHGLEEIPCKDLLTMEKLMHSLKTKGPLLINGRFGKDFYAGLEPTKFEEKVGGHDLYGWKKGALTVSGIGFTHVIVLVGAEIKAGKAYVYWIDPAEPNDPAQPGGQRWYVSSFQAIASRMASLVGLSIDQLTPQSRAIVPGALCNPLFAE